MLPRQRRRSRTGALLLTGALAGSTTGAGTGGGVEVTSTDGRTAAATVIGTDPTSDLAVVEVRGVSDLTAATFADSDQLEVGQAVLAVGAPLGLSNTVTEGIVSTLHRPVRTGEEGASAQSVIDAVQTDAAINPGNSGGALVDLAGRVVGINSAIATSGHGSSGNIDVGFAIASNDATEVVDELIEDGTADHRSSASGCPTRRRGAADLRHHRRRRRPRRPSAGRRRHAGRQSPGRRRRQPHRLGPRRRPRRQR